MEKSVTNPSRSKRHGGRARDIPEPVQQTGELEIQKPKLQVWVILDLFRFEEGDEGATWVHKPNAATFGHMIAACLGGVEGLHVEILDHAALGQSLELLVQGNFREAWLSTYREALPSDIAQRLASIVADRFVILIEPSPALRIVVENAAAFTLELTTHPARLLPELLLLARSSLPAIQQALASVSVSEGELAWHYRSWKARHHHAQRLQQPGEPSWPTFGLLLGQMPFDSAMIREGRFVDLADYESEIRAAAQKHRLMFARAHPYAPFTDRTLGMLSQIPGIVFTSANFYSLASHPLCQGVYAVSSSGLQEARWFGTPATSLAVPPSEPGASTWLTVAPYAIAEAVAPIVASHFGLPLKEHLGRFQLPTNPILRPLVQETWSRAEPEIAEGIPPLHALPTTRLSVEKLEGAGCLAYSWLPAESWGVWSSGPVAAVSLPWVYGEQAQVILECVAATSPREKPTELSIFCDGLLLAKEPLAPIGADPSILIFVVPRPSNGAVATLMLVASDVAEPRPGLDPRRLGVGLVSLQVPRRYPSG
jgi:hypothetical protein